MGEPDTIRIKKRYKIRKRVSKKKEKRIRKWKKAGHQMFSFILVLFLFPLFYFLVWGLMIEPQLPRHIYGPGDFKEMIYIFISLFIMLISYLMIRLIKYKPLSMEWWQNTKLLHSVNYNFEKYSAFKDVGINYHHQKKKAENQKRKSSKHYHKSITEE